MSLDEKKSWKSILYLAVIFLILCYVQKVLLFFNVNFAHTLSSIIIYGGGVFLAATIGMLYFLKKKYNTPSAEVFRDKELRFLIYTVAALGLGIPILGLSLG